LRLRCTTLPRLTSRFIRLLAKLYYPVEVTDATNQVKAKTKAFSTIAIPIGNDFKSFDEPYYVFI